MHLPAYPNRRDLQTELHAERSVVNGGEDGAERQIHEHHIWLIVGGALGGVVSLIMGANVRQGIVLNVVVGIVGAVVGESFLEPVPLRSRGQ